MSTRPRNADLTPPLGWYGGPCLVVERIRQEVKNPRLRDNLEDQVESGKALSNPDAAQVYDIEGEKGVGLFRQVRITPHAQYRMDLRGVTVGDIRIALGDFLKKLNDWKSQQAWEYRTYTEALSTGRPVEWIDKRLGDLVVIFATSRQGGGMVDIITTYWKGLPDPKPETCPVRNAYSALPGDLSGFRTFVKEPHPQKSDTGDGKYKERALPSPPWKREKPTGAPSYNTPGESGSSGDGRSIHKDKARTQGVPGERSPHPDPPARNTIKRRPDVTADGDVLEAGMTGPPFPGANRQQLQKGQAKSYDKKQYRRDRNRVIRQQKLRYKKLRRNPRFQRDRKLRKKFPERFERFHGGPSSIAERSRDQRDKKAAFEPVPFFYEPLDDWAWVVDVSPGGAVHFVTDESEFTEPLDVFVELAAFDEDDFPRFLSQLDTIFEYMNDDLVEKLARRFFADVLIERRPPENPQKVDRAHGHGNRVPSMCPAEGLRYDDEVHDSNPGSRVLPSGKGHIEKEAALIRDIQRDCGPDLVARAKGVRPKLSRVDAKNGIWLFDVPGSEGSHRVRIKAVRQGNVRDMNKVHVLVSCSCPFWRWQGPEYWAKAGGYLYGKPRGLASKPDVKDPNGQHRACKHALAVFTHILDRGWQAAPRSKQGDLRFLADSLTWGEVFVVSPEFEQSVERVAARYLHSEVP